MVSSKDGVEEARRLGKSSRLRGISIEPDRATYAFERFAKAGQVRAFPESIGFRPTRKAC